MAAPWVLHELFTNPFSNLSSLSSCLPQQVRNATLVHPLHGPNYITSASYSSPKDQPAHRYRTYWRSSLDHVHHDVLQRRWKLTYVHSCSIGRVNVVIFIARIIYHNLFEVGFYYPTEYSCFNLSQGRTKRGTWSWTVVPSSDLASAPWTPIHETAPLRPRTSSPSGPFGNSLQKEETIDGIRGAPTSHRRGLELGQSSLGLWCIPIILPSGRPLGKP
jgi:hypothetical protein